LAKPRQRIPIQDTPKGRVLDIGSGGEGVIAQAGGARVVGIDKLVSEIHEARAKAPDIPWVVADATELPCANHCFDSATSFFSCMYMSDDVKAGVFRENRRVLPYLCCSQTLAVGSPPVEEIHVTGLLTKQGGEGKA
jgi:SAM-dependent methyltransferase